MRGPHAGSPRGVLIARVRLMAETNPAYSVAEENLAYTDVHILAYPVEYIAGIDLYNAGEFHAAHDAWEERWMGEVGAARAFSVLRTFHLSSSGEIAVNIVSRALSVINTSGFIVSLLLLLTVFTIKRSSGHRLLFVEIISLAGVAISTGIGQWVVA